jgi:hypothetical protein
MGYAMAMSACVGCKRVFMYNPHKVPSIRHNGFREPVCRECIEHANPIRVKNGLEPFNIDPQAYEPIDEHELS